MSRRVRAYFLLEILIGLSLLSMLLVILFSFMAQSAQVEKRLERAYATIVERQNLQVRLQDVFTSLTRERDLKPLYTKRFPKEGSDSLIALFDNGVDPDPAFSGAILARVFADEQKNLCLALWPIAKDKTSSRPFRKEILLRQIDSYAFEFLGEKQGHDLNVNSITAHAGWHPVWKETRSDVPSIVRLTIQGPDGPIRFAFRLPTSEPIATYVTRGANL